MLYGRGDPFFAARRVQTRVCPSIAAGALRDEAVFSDLVALRLNEFKANASSSSPEELVRLDHPEGDDPERFADEMWGIPKDFGLRVLGGCCGTEDRHMGALALRMGCTGHFGGSA